jgi:ELWxxDGT repeat protein
MTLADGRGNGLWKLDNSAQGASRVDLFADRTRPFNQFWKVGDLVYFTTGGEGVEGQPLELWKSDGTREGTQLVRRFPDTGVNQTLRIQGGADVGGTFFFTAAPDGTLQTTALWRSDGADAGTVVVARYSDGDSRFGNGQIGALFGFSNQLYFYAEALGRGAEPHLLTATTGDTNWDGLVDLADFALLKSSFGRVGTLAQGDLDGSGRIDLSDFGVLKASLAGRNPTASATSSPKVAASDWLFAVWNSVMEREPDDVPIEAELFT